jgi:tetratricopeptide (TPR) repeat protein
LTAARPSNEAILSALDRVVASETFSRSDRARKLLDYLVRTESAGQADRLKGFAIAMDVFGKDADFDPATDAVVRVQAGRLRDLLDQYYAGEGSGERLRIAIARGTYVPTYVAASVPETAGAAHTDGAVELDSSRIGAAIAARFSESQMDPLLIGGDRGSRDSGFIASILRHVKLFRAGLAFIIVLLAFVAWRVASDRPLPPTSGEATASVLPRGSRGAATDTLLPLIRLSVRSPENAGVRRVASLLKAALPAFDSVAFVGDGPSINPKPDEFVVRVEPAVVATRTLISVEHVMSGRSLASTIIDSEADADTQDAAFAGFLNAMIPVSGAIYAFIAENGPETSLTTCLLLENRFFRDLHAEDHAAAYSCFEELAGKGAKSPLVWAELADLQAAAVTGDLTTDSDVSIASAIRFARKALELGPNSAAAFRAQGYILDRSGDPESGLDWMERAAAINPYDMSLVASSGNILVLTGDYEKGTQRLSRAIRIAPVHPHWWDYAEYLGAFMTGRKEDAWRAADSLVDSDRRLYLAARLVAAVDRGRISEAREIAQKLETRDAAFLSDPLTAFRKSRYAPDLADRFSRAIKDALAVTGASGNG